MRAGRAFVEGRSAVGGRYFWRRCGFCGGVGPGEEGVIHARVNVTESGTTTVPRLGSPNVTIIDPSAGQACISPDGPVPNQTEISWNVTGPPGPPRVGGAQGAPGATGPAGSSKASTVVLAAPVVKSTDRPVGKVTLDTGSHSLSSPFLAYSLASSATLSTATVDRASGAKLNQITITKRIDSASPKLLLAASSGRQFTSVRVVFPEKVVRRSSGTKPKQYMTMTMPYVEDITDGGGAGGSSAKSGTPLGTMSLKFMKIQTRSRIQAKGEGG